MELPWSDEQARWIIRRAATLGMAGAEPVGPYVLPTAKFFPDRFDRTPKSVGTLFDRLRDHVGLSDTQAEVVIVDPDEGTIVSSCSSGGCGSGVKTLAGERVVETDEGYTVAVAVPEVGNATVLTTVLCRALGQIFLREVDVMGRFNKVERQAAGDLAASLLGLGVLIANGSAIQVKGCGGVKVHSATSLGAPESVLALALGLERRPGSAAALASGELERALDPVPRDFLGAARAFVVANRSIVRRLDDGPDSVESGEFSLRAPSVGFGVKIRKLFGLGAGKDVDPLEALEREASVVPASTRQRKSSKNDRFDEIRALVDESFEQSPPQS